MECGQPPCRSTWLNGREFGRTVIGGRTWVCGNHGLAILAPGTRLDEARLATLTRKPEIRQNADQVLRAAAKNVKTPRPLLPNHLSNETNPYVLAEFAWDAHRYVGQPEGRALIPPLIALLDSENDRVRRNATWTLARWDLDGVDEASRAILPRLQDSVPEIRGFAALALARWGVAFDLAALAEANRNDVSEALARAPVSEEVFELMTNHFPVRDHQSEELDIVAANLRANPKFAKILLGVKNTRKWNENRKFVRFVFQRANDPGFLPEAHAALKSDDRVIRANAALVCGAIGHASSVQPLLDALELESGFSRGAIVVALGEIGEPAEAAIPKLRELYRDVVNTPTSSFGNMRYAQVGVLNAGQISAQSLGQIRHDLGSVRQTIAGNHVPPTPDPRNERLLDVQMIYEALSRIGPGNSEVQAFFRAVAGKERHIGYGYIPFFAKVLGTPGPDSAKNLAALQMLAQRENHEELRKAIRRLKGG